MCVCVCVCVCVCTYVVCVHTSERACVRAPTYPNQGTGQYRNDVLLSPRTNQTVTQTHQLYIPASNQPITSLGDESCACLHPLSTGPARASKADSWDFRSGNSGTANGVFEGCLGPSGLDTQTRINKDSPRVRFMPLSSLGVRESALSHSRQTKARK